MPSHRSGPLGRSFSLACSWPLGIAKKHYKTNGFEHMGPTGGSMDPPWDLLVTFHSSAKSTPGCSQEHYLSTWPSQSTPWALLESSSKFLASSWGFLRCLKITLKQMVWSTWPSRGPPWTPGWSLTRPMCPQVVPPDGPDDPQMGPNLPQVAPRWVPMTPK